MCSHSISSPFLLFQERLRSESMCGAEFQKKKNLNFFPHYYLHFALLFKKNGLCFHNTRTYVSLLRLCYKTRMLRTFFAKSILNMRNSITTRKTKHWSIDVWTENEIPTHQNEQRSSENQPMTWRRESSSLPTQLPRSTKKRTPFLHIIDQPKHDNLCLQRSSKWNIWWIPLLAACLIKFFLSLSDSKKVCMGIIEQNQNLKDLDVNYFEITHEFWPAFMLWKHWIKTDAGSLSNQSAPISLKLKKDIQRHNLHQQTKKFPTLFIKEMKIIDWTSLFQRKMMNWIDQWECVSITNKGKRTNRILKMFPLNNFKYF